MVLEVIQREIPVRGIGYIILRDCPEDRLGEALGKGMEKLKKAGAKQVWAASLPEGEPLHPGPVGVWRLTHVHDLLTFARPLAGRDRPAVRLSLRPLKKALDDKCYAELMDRAYRDVPNARTVDPAGLRIPNHRLGLAWLGDRFVGAYHLDLSEKVPEITALAIDPEFRRQGFGQALLLSLMDTLGKAEKCVLTVSSANAPALALLEKAGFAQTGVDSSWFEVV
ncbi:MAG: N-acetyltransferase [Clostridiales bacterium]|nr:N-acetyltransferase [Clostridiales bacterium]